ncbi:unnamed protein product [Tetraodon nigroviridis]|uniref:(spotted green pufferfish) hypothetical protein n=1 Tax=Tetraodon nigroviridis TaxID=99883 RepID=Q4RL30_TETNG|nr:unnamed protein product [Tetraodon nigroviridis]
MCDEWCVCPATDWRPVQGGLTLTLTLRELEMGTSRPPRHHWVESG